MQVPLYLNSTQNTSVNWISRLLLSFLCWPKVILLSSGHCNYLIIDNGSLLIITSYPMFREQNMPIRRGAVPMTKVPMPTPITDWFGKKIKWIKVCLLYVSLGLQKRAEGTSKKRILPFVFDSKKYMKLYNYKLHFFYLELEKINTLGEINWLPISSTFNEQLFCTQV